jgi:molecular chaperone DnaK
MGNVIGIDLGTTFSAVAHIDESGRPAIVLNDRGDNITPSCVAMHKGALVVGEVARRTWGNDPENAASRFKRDMGTSSIYTIASKEYTSTQLSAEVLKKLKNDTEGKIGAIDEVVVTIPANFAQDARNATMEAAALAGLNVKYIINEPTAAALYYAFQSDGNLSGTFVVFDLGGGTFDVSVIKVNGQDIDVVSSNGLNKLGGDDFDNILWSLVAGKYAKESGQELTREDFPINAAEEEKKSLSQRKRTTAEIERDLVDLSRIEYEEAISSLVAQVEMMCEATLDEAGVEPSDITKVFLAGGSTRMPAITECAKRVFKQDPVATANVDEVVALGAALYAAYKGDAENLTAIQKQSVSKLTVTETTNMCFGTIALGYSESKGDSLVNSIIINKGEKIPCKITESYFTVREGQTAIECKITESKSAETNPKFVKEIWSGDLELPADRPTEQEVQITYSYDENQMMHASFKDMGSGKETSISLSMGGGKNQSSDINKFLVD